MLVSIQVLRGVAALFVVVAHLPWLPFRTIHPGFPSLAMGYSGVDIFFVISGFIMVLTTRNAAGWRSAGGFLLRRAIRILPLYWLLTLIAVVQFSSDYAGQRFGTVGWTIIWHSFALIPHPYTQDLEPFWPLIIQGWTLEFEVFFYVVLAAVICLVPRYKVVVACLGLAGLCLIGQWVEFGVPLVFYARSITLEFVFGMIIASIRLRGVRLPISASVALVVAGLGGLWGFVPHVDEYMYVRGLGWGIPAALLVGGLALGRKVEWKALTRPLVALGDMSYSLYLVHNFVYETWYYAYSGGRPMTLLSARLFPWMVLSAIATSYLLYVKLELPLTRALQRRLLGHVHAVPFPIVVEDKLAA